MEGHRIPDKIELKNIDWLNEGCMTEVPNYIKNITYEDLERISDERNNK